MLNVKGIISVAIVLVLGFGVWLFYWPLMEAFYAMSWLPLLAKLPSFILGCILMLFGSYAGYRVIL